MKIFKNYGFMHFMSDSYSKYKNLDLHVYVNMHTNIPSSLAYSRSRKQITP
jgi:hypothetical protein